MTQALTDDDGRVRDLLGGRWRRGSIAWSSTSPAGARTATTATARFFRRLAVDLSIADIGRSYHVPLLLAPYSMTTYRGS